jgi:hypothetical protein
MAGTFIGDRTMPADKTSFGSPQENDGPPTDESVHEPQRIRASARGALKTSLDRGEEIGRNRTGLIALTGLVLAFLSVFAVPFLQVGGPDTAPRDPETPAVAPLTATSPATAPPAEVEEVVPTLEGEVGHFAAGKAFSDLIYDNEGKIIRLNVRFPGEDFTGEIEPEPYFTIYDECWEPLAEGELPNFRKCSGLSVSIAEPDGVADYGFGYTNGEYYLLGYFAVISVGGRHQGLMGAVVRPLAIADIAPGLVRSK